MLFKNEQLAVVRKPGMSIQNGLRLKDLGEVDPKKAKIQHLNYCQALENMGFKLIILPPLEKYPDSVFVEDSAIIAKETLITTRLRKEERRGEEKLLEKELVKFYSDVRKIKTPGYIEGGDVLILDKGSYIGISRRTNLEGASQLSKILYKLGFKYTTFIELPSDMLHLKGAMSYHRISPNENLLIISEELYYRFKNVNLERESKVLVTPAEERFGANCINSGKDFLIHSGRKKTKALLRKKGFNVVEIDISEFEKIDGAMTCLSKFFNNKLS
ncbi:MAG: N(G),N(G)-dimethylarginine dimethylaminohydrolase [Parcubacteria group bacterium]|nr:N(G),N(G)-dimethylarginine dimethylaminohydrolase [Parcubacteria group bacterium]